MSTGAKCGDDVNRDGDSLEDIADTWERFRGNFSIEAFVDGRWLAQIGPGKMIEACDGSFPVESLRITAKHADLFNPRRMDAGDWATGAVKRQMIIRAKYGDKLYEFETAEAALSLMARCPQTGTWTAIKSDAERGEQGAASDSGLFSSCVMCGKPIKDHSRDTYAACARKCYDETMAYLWSKGDD